jgi:hypothetical protein
VNVLPRLLLKLVASRGRYFRGGGSYFQGGVTFGLLISAPAYVMLQCLFLCPSIIGSIHILNLLDVTTY